MIAIHPCLHVVMYHYVRDLPRTRFPRIKGMLTSDFRRQVALLVERYEMASLESALAFLAGTYRPARDLCLLTFDDGLKEHANEVTPFLMEKRIQGLFFLATVCQEEEQVLPVHKNHFLLAALDFGDYRRAFLEQLARISPETETEVDETQARRNYRWDTPEVAAFKQLLNFHLPEVLRCRTLDVLFREYLGDERAFARELYLSWEEARAMQACGMLVGGHSHRHVALATLDGDGQSLELETCASVLHRRLRAQALWPFSYPFGKPVSSFTAQTARLVSDTGFSCAFATEVGTNGVGTDRFAVRRIDPRDVAA